MRKILVCLAVIALWGAQAEAKVLDIHVSQGSGWILLSLGDLNQRLRLAGYPAVSETTLLYGTTSVFPQPDASWRWGVAGLFWTARGGETVTLSSNLVGGVFDWTLREMGRSRVTAGVLAGAALGQLSVRKGIAFDFGDVLHPSQGQFTLIQRWGLWGAPYLQYELVVVESAFFVRAWGGMVLTPWISPWSQVATFFSGLSFDGPPANLGGPFGLVELSFGF